MQTGKVLGCVLQSRSYELRYSRCSALEIQAARLLSSVSGWRRTAGQTNYLCLFQPWLPQDEWKGPQTRPAVHRCTSQLNVDGLRAIAAWSIRRRRLRHCPSVPATIHWRGDHSPRHTEYLVAGHYSATTCGQVGPPG